jgi:hypothetical protein
LRSKRGRRNPLTATLFERFPAPNAKAPAVNAGNYLESWLSGAQSIIAHNGELFNFQSSLAKSPRYLELLNSDQIIEYRREIGWILFQKN